MTGALIGPYEVGEKLGEGGWAKSSAPATPSSSATSR